MAVHWQGFAIAPQFYALYNVYAQNCISYRSWQQNTIFDGAFCCHFRYINKVIPFGVA